MSFLEIVGRRDRRTAGAMPVVVARELYSCL